MTIQTVGDLTSFKWATVTAVNPLAIKIDGDSTPLALIPDTLVDPQSLWVGARVRVELSLRKVVIHGVHAGADGFGPGDIIATARATARTGWMLCQGQSLLRSDYPGLFAAIGTAYGAADSTHFSLPDGRGRVLIGAGTATGAAGATAHALGQVGGEETHVMSATEMPTHSHPSPTGYFYVETNIGSMRRAATINNAGSTGEDGVWRQRIAESGGNPMGTANAGGGAAHNNLQPYATGNWMIKL